MQGRVLVVDDEKAIRDLLCKILKAQHFEVHWAKDGYGALEVLESELIDLVITDISMPKMDGTDLTNQIRYKYKKIPIEVLSGKGTRENFIRAIKAGAVDFMVKGSFKPDEFVRRISKYINPISKEKNATPMEAFAKRFSKTLSSKREEE